MKIKVTEFAERHFDPKFGGTKILDYTKEEFELELTFLNGEIDLNNEGEILPGKCKIDYFGDVIIHDGYAPFCKLIAIPNFTNARVGTLPITLENYQYIRSGYSARRDEELPVFSRWLELPIGKPKAKWLVLVLYNKEQIDKEAMGDYNKKHKIYSAKTSLMTVNEIYNSCIEIPEEPKPFDGDWGVVAILGQSHPNEEPMKPETMIRNALGVEEGGSGVPLNKKKYLESVKFWSENVTVK